MTSKKKKINFIFNAEDNFYSVYTETQTPNNVIWDIIGYVELITDKKIYAFHPNKKITHYGEFTLRKIANFISKLNKQLEQKEKVRC